MISCSVNLVSSLRTSALVSDLPETAVDILDPAVGTFFPYAVGADDRMARVLPLKRAEYSKLPLLLPCLKILDVQNFEGHTSEDFFNKFLI